MSTDQRDEITRLLAAVASAANTAAYLVADGRHTGAGFRQDISAMRAQLDRLSRMASSLGGEKHQPGQWCWCSDVPEGQVPHDCAEDHGTRPQCQADGAHVHPWRERTGA